MALAIGPLLFFLLFALYLGICDWCYDLGLKPQASCVSNWLNEIFKKDFETTSTGFFGKAHEK